MIRLGGLDLSLTSTGIARLELDDDGAVTGSRTEVVKGDPLPKDAPWDDRADRVRRYALDVCDALLPILGRRPPDLLVVEGPSFGSNRPGASELHGLRWRVYSTLARHGATLVEVAPKTLKLYATFDGGAGKPLVVQAIRRHYGHLFDLPLLKADGLEDVADATGLVAMGARSIGHPIDLDHPVRIRAMRAPRWVTLRGRQTCP